MNGGLNYMKCMTTEEMIAFVLGFKVPYEDMWKHKSAFTEIGIELKRDIINGRDFGIDVLSLDADLVQYLIAQGETSFTYKGLTFIESKKGESK